MQIIKEKLDVDDELEKRIKNILKFLNIKSKIIKGNIIHIPKTNIAYIEPHKLEINEITYLFFNECENIYINTLEKSIPFNKLETRIKDTLKKQKEELELDQYNFTFEDIMLKRDLESIKCLINQLYQSSFEIKWNELTISEKQDLIMSYIESIEVIKKDNNELEIKQINFRKTFIEEYANLFNKDAINRFQDINVNGEVMQVEVCAPTTRKEVENHIKRLQVNYPIDYQEIKKEKYNDHQFCLKYTRENPFNEPLKLIPLINKKGINKVDIFGVIEVPVPPITYIYAKDNSFSDLER